MANLSSPGAVALFLSLTPVSLAVANPANDFVIVPGRSLGPLHLPATEAGVLLAFRGHAITEDIELPEGAYVRGTGLFGCDPHTSVDLFYDKDRGRQLTEIRIQRIYGNDSAPCDEQPPATADPMLKGQQPGDVLDLNQYDWRHRNENSAGQSVISAGSRGHPRQTATWRLENGVQLGTDLGTLQRLNGRPFHIQGPEGDGPGGVDWRGGMLENCTWDIVLAGQTAEGDTGKQYESDDKSLRATGSWVETLVVALAPVPGATPPDCGRTHRVAK